MESCGIQMVQWGTLWGIWKSMTLSHQRHAVGIGEGSLSPDSGVLGPGWDSKVGL